MVDSSQFQRVGSCRGRQLRLLLLRLFLLPIQNALAELAHFGVCGHAGAIAGWVVVGGAATLTRDLVFFQRHAAGLSVWRRLLRDCIRGVRWLQGRGGSRWRHSLRRLTRAEVGRRGLLPRREKRLWLSSLALARALHGATTAHQVIC